MPYYFMHSETLVVIDAPHFYAGLVFTDLVVTEAAPILRWAIGKDATWLGAYCRKKHWKGGDYALDNTSRN